MSYKQGFEAALDVVLEILRAGTDAAFGEVEMLSHRVRGEKARAILATLNGP